MRSLLVAVAFLTVVPVRFRDFPSESEVARSRFWYPVVGLLLGALLGGTLALVAPLKLPLVGAFLVLLLWVGLTGALHLDGFCDLCDGLFGARTPEERLRIMKDPHLGTFGLAGGILLLLGKFAALAALIEMDRGPWVVAAAVTTARCLVLFLAAGARYPRTEGTGKALIEGMPAREGNWLWAPLGAVLGLLGWPRLETGSILAVVLPNFLAVLGLGVLCHHRLRGITGDCLGAGIELAEVVYLFAVVLTS
jgi:adenosylcobinamide-GDP ribazoletransferase